MYVYIDETGNTGLDIFNEKQPFFMNMATMSPQQIDIAYKDEFNQILSTLQVKELHGTKMPSFESYNHASKLLYDFLLKKDIKFTYTVIDKILFSQTILFDELFDSGINEAVPWHSYNFREQRLILLLNFIALIHLTQEVHKKFWNECLFGKNISDADNSFISCINNLLSKLSNIDLDKRSIEIFYNTLQWAKKNYTQFAYRIGYNQTDKDYNNIYLPTYGFLISLLKNIQDEYKNSNSDKCYLIHDRQQEYQNKITLAHKIVTNPAIKRLHLGISYYKDTSILTLPQSSLSFVDAKKSIGIQLSDFCASILGKKIKKKEMTPDMKNLHNLIKEKTTDTHIFTYDSLVNELISFEHILQKEEKQLDHKTRQEQLQKAKEFIEQENLRIQKVMEALD